MVDTTERSRSNSFVCLDHERSSNLPGKKKAKTLAAFLEEAGRKA